MYKVYFYIYKYILIQLMSTLVELLKELSKNAKQYTVDDNCNVITDKFDFTKKADLDKLKEKVNELKNNDNPLINYIKLLSGDAYDNTLDSIVADAEKIYNDSQKTRKEVDKSVMSSNERRPSDKVAEEMKKQISKLTVEYLNELIIPNFKNITTAQATSIYDSLFEFACWIYSK